jgi:hypothetical protein
MIKNNQNLEQVVDMLMREKMAEGRNGSKKNKFKESEIRKDSFDSSDFDLKDDLKDKK